MISDKIKNLFCFIDFLHSNIENFKQFNDLANELNLLSIESGKLSPEKNYNDKFKYDELLKKITEKSDILNQNVISVIRNKAHELMVFNLNNLDSIYDSNLSEIRNLKNNLSERDVPEILMYNNKYKEYRAKTNCDYKDGYFFFQLDKILKVLFDYFEDSPLSEFETKTIKDNNFTDLTNFINENQEKALSLNLLDYATINNVLQKQKDKLRDAEFESEFLEVKKFAEERIKELKHNLQLELRNNNVKINYKNGVAPYLWIIRLLLEYKELLKPQQKEVQQFQQTETSKPDKVKKELHPHIFKDNAFEIWESLYVNFNINQTKRTDLRFMYEIMKYEGQIHNTITVKNITDWINETYQFSIDKLQYTSIRDKSNENRMSIYTLIKTKV